MNYPPRMYTSEVLELTRWGAAKLAKLRKQHAFPDPIDRGREAIYDGKSVYKALGLLSEHSENPWDRTLNGGTQA